jgi:N-acetylglucosamine-6-phosphate deacetylase
MLIKNATVFLPEGRFEKCDVRFEERIVEVGRLPGEGVDADGLYLIPGLIDLHTHGAKDCDFSDGRPEDMPKMAAHYAQHGVTSFLATTMTLPEDTLVSAAKAIGAYQMGPGMARCMGIHMEGPFFCYEKRGAQCADYLHDPEVAFFDHVNQAAGGAVKLIAVAPELPGAIPFIREVSSRCAVSVGHTSADYDTACQAYDAGATQATHLFNAMPPIHHRKPGVIPAAMDKGAWAELICDGQHVHPAVIRAAFAMFPGRIVLISDSLRCAGMPEGEYSLGGQKVYMKDNLARLKDGTIAGSVITVMDGMRNVVKFGIPLETAVASATLHPAKAVGLQDAIGAIRPGLLGDVVLLNPDLSIHRVYIGGKSTVA